MTREQISLANRLAHQSPSSTNKRWLWRTQAEHSRLKNGPPLMRTLCIHKNVPVSGTTLTLGLRVGFISSHLTADKLFPVNPRVIMGPSGGQVFHHVHGSGRQPTDRNQTQLRSQKLQHHDNLWLFNPTTPNDSHWNHPQTGKRHRHAQPAQQILMFVNTQKSSDLGQTVRVVVKTEHI